MKYQVNDILYTKDGRRSGNLTVVDTYDLTKDGITNTHYTFISDYGNIVRGFIIGDKLFNKFYRTPGKASPTHKYYNYKQTHPEEFI